MRSSQRRVATLAASLALVAGLAACGNDDDAASPTTSSGNETSMTEAPTTEPTASGEPSDGDAAGCDEYATVSGQLMIGMVDPADAPAILDGFVAAAPDPVRGDAEVLAEGFTAMFAAENPEEGGDPFADPAFTVAYSNLGEHFFDHCPADAKLDVKGIDYAFVDLPSEIPAGRVALRLTNETEAGEPHELALLRRPDGDETTIGEIATTDPDVLIEDYGFVGVAFADAPGTSNVTFLDLEPGSYVAVCFLPTDGDETDPHAAHGMAAGVEVVAS